MSAAKEPSVAELVDRIFDAGRTVEHYDDPRLKPLSRESFARYESARRAKAAALRALERLQSERDRAVAILRKVTSSPTASTMLEAHALLREIDGEGQ